MKTIFLERRSGEPFLYDAGQFLTLLFTFRGHELRRSYSFSTAPGVDPVPAITVKRVPNGEISRHLLDHLKVGDTLTTLPPAGRFKISDRESDGSISLRGGVVFIAAGSGVVPVFSLLKQVLREHPGGRPHLLTQQHDEESSPFRATLIRMGLNWTEMLTVRDGRLTKDKLGDWVLAAGLPPETRFYLCGPPDFMRMVHITLRTLGFREEAIRREHFTAGHIPPAPPVWNQYRHPNEQSHRSRHHRPSCRIQMIPQIMRYLTKRSTMSSSREEADRSPHMQSKEAAATIGHTQSATARHDPSLPPL